MARLIAAVTGELVGGEVDRRHGAWLNVSSHDTINESKRLGIAFGYIGAFERRKTEMEEKDQKIHNPQAEFDKPTDVLKDPELSETDKKKALENLEQDAHQLMTASNEGMAPENEVISKHEPKLDEVVKAQHRMGEKPQNKPTQ